MARPRRSTVRVQASAAPLNDGLGFETMRDGIKVAAKETLLTPRFYTTGERPKAPPVVQHPCTAPAATRLQAHSAFRSGLRTH